MKFGGFERKGGRRHERFIDSFIKMDRPVLTNLASYILGVILQSHFLLFCPIIAAFLFTCMS